METFPIPGVCDCDPEPTFFYENGACSHCGRLPDEDTQGGISSKQAVAWNAEQERRARESEPRHPMQPVVWRGDVIRFKENAIVQRLIDHGQATELGLIELRQLGFSDDDWSQFNQLIGYSVCGYCDLTGADPITADQATLEAQRLSDKRWSTK